LKLLLLRDTFTDESTTGELFVDGVFECFILEDRVRPKGVKVYGKTAIPEGVYEIVITKSVRFKRFLPLLLNVPKFSGIRIHPGNKAVDTEGCLLPGTKRARNVVFESRKAFDRLFTRIKAARAKGETVTIEIKRGASK